MGEIIMGILVLLCVVTYACGSMLCQCAHEKKWRKVGAVMMVGCFVWIMLALLVSSMIWGV